jgi:hypothetical protein
VGPVGEAARPTRGGRKMLPSRHPCRRREPVQLHGLGRDACGRRTPGRGARRVQGRDCQLSDVCASVDGVGAARGASGEGFWRFGISDARGAAEGLRVWGPWSASCMSGSLVNLGVIQGLQGLGTLIHEWWLSTCAVMWLLIESQNGGSDCLCCWLEGCRL